MRFPGFGRKQGTSRVDALLKAIRSKKDDGLMVRVVVITKDEDFHSMLQRIAGACEWRIRRAGSIDEVEALIGTKPTPMVVYDRDSSNKNWRDAVRCLSELPAHPCVLLASRVADNYLMDEVVRNHGYDILPKSVAMERLIECLRFAWLWARTGGHDRH